jgi:hypothetical protein
MSIIYIINIKGIKEKACFNLLNNKNLRSGYIINIIYLSSLF